MRDVSLSAPNSADIDQSGSSVSCAMLEIESRVLLSAFATARRVRFRPIKMEERPKRSHSTSVTPRTRRNGRNASRARARELRQYPFSEA